jgi:hypothetical protein
MKKQFTGFGLVVAVIIGISSFFVGCSKDDMNDVVLYKGQVVYINTTIPFPDLTVKVTNGRDTHCQTQTDAGGLFSLKVRVNEIDGNYYLLAGDSTCIPKKVNLGSYGQAEVDLGVIEVEGPTLPTVVTNEVSSVSGRSAVAGGNVTSDGRLELSARGICYGITPYPTIESTHTFEGTSVGSFTSKLENLEPKTVYYVRAYATNSKGTSYGEQMFFVTTEGMPVVQTNPVTDVTYNSAHVSGSILDNGGSQLEDFGICWSLNMTPTINDNHYSCMGQADFAYTIENLERNATYYVRAYARNSAGLSYGNEVSFSTIDGLPAVTTTSITNVHSTSATSGGNVISNGGYPVTARGVCWSSTSAAPTINDSHTVDGKGNGTFISQLTGLSPETAYYVRAYATNSAGTSYGEQMYFVTIDGLPQITTSTVTNIQGTSATCGGTITSDGGSSVVARGVCWSAVTASPTINDSHTTDGVGNGSFVSHMTNLTENTSYYVRAYATNGTGTSYGEQQYFTTAIDNKATVVQTLNASNITTTSATLNGNITQAGYPAYTERGFCYNTSGMPTIYDTKVPVSGNGTGAYTATISIGINDYYVRAYAIQNGQPIYGQQVTFGPELVGPTIFIGSAQNIGANSATITATISNAGSPAYSKRGFCYGIYTDPTIESGNCSYVEETASTPGEYGMTLSNLNPNTLYYVKAFVEWMGRRVYSNAIHFYTEEEVTVMIENELLNAQCVVNNSKITWSGMLLGGTYASTSYISLGFVYDKNPNPTVGNGTATQVQYNNTQSENNVLGFYANVSGLENATSYYVRAYVQMSYGYVYSDQIIIQMHPIEPNIQTYAIANLQSVNAGTSSEYWQAQFQGVFYSDGKPAAQDWGFVYGTNSNPVVNDGSSIMVSRQQHVAVPNTTYYAFATNVTGLSSNKVYYVRAYARTAAGYTYGGVLSFTTY